MTSIDHPFLHVTSRFHVVSLVVVEVVVEVVVVVVVVAVIVVVFLSFGT